MDPERLTTTNGTGKPEDYSLAELKKLRLKNGAGCRTRHQIPTLRETMLLCKGKILVNVDKGYEYFLDGRIFFYYYYYIYV